MTHDKTAIKDVLRLLAIPVAVCIALAVPAQADPVLTLSPTDGTISGTQGATIGWGFTITNTADFLEVTSSAFCLNPVSTPFCTTSTLGTYTDIISSESSAVVVGPSPEKTSVTQGFNGTTPSGVGSFLISSSAVSGSIDRGEIVLTYDLFSVSPNSPSFDPTLDTISTDNFLTAPAAVGVNVASTPEPGSFALVAAALLLLAVLSAIGRLRRSHD